MFEKALADLAPTICFAVKANGNIAVIRLLERLGAGADVVSGGELTRALAAGVAPENTASLVSLPANLFDDGKARHFEHVSGDFKIKFLQQGNA